MRIRSTQQLVAPKQSESGALFFAVPEDEVEGSLLHWVCDEFTIGRIITAHETVSPATAPHAEMPSCSLHIVGSSL